MYKVAFFIKHFTERGTEKSTFDYADFNETILGIIKPLPLIETLGSSVFEKTFSEHIFSLFRTWYRYYKRTNADSPGSSLHVRWRCYR